MLELIINGEPRQVAEVVTLADLVLALGLGGKRVAIECNGEIVPRSLHATTALRARDVLEIVVAVGGG